MVNYTSAIADLKQSREVTQKLMYSLQDTSCSLKKRQYVDLVQKNIEEHAFQSLVASLLVPF